VNKREALDTVVQVYNNGEQIIDRQHAPDWIKAMMKVQLAATCAVQARLIAAQREKDHGSRGSDTLVKV
jgi:hypothetical protein